MHARTLSHLISTTLAVAGLSLGVTATAFAVPSDGDCACGGARVPAHAGGVPAGSDAAAPLTGSRSDEVRQVAATVPRVDQPAPTWPLHPVSLHAPQTAAPSADRDFQWGDAGIGAGGTLVIVVTALGGVMAVRRRHAADPPLAA
jgi:hypothetical protein